MVCADTARELAKRGHEVYLAASMDSPVKWWEQQGVRFIPTLYSSLTPIPEVEMKDILYARVKDWKYYDMVIDDSHLHITTPAQKEFSRSGQGWLKRIHDVKQFAQPPPVDYPGFVCPSHGLAETMSARTTWFVGKVCQHGIDLSRYPYIAGSHSSRYLFLGRVQWLKGVDVVINACEELGLELDIIGPTTHLKGDPYSRSIQSISSEQITVHGEVSHERKVEFLSSCKATIFPSRFEEPFGLMVSEAMACGAIPLVSAMGGLPEQVSDGCGMVFHHAAELLSTLSLLEKYPDLLSQEVRSKCRERVEQKFTVQRMVDRILALGKSAMTHPW